MNLFSKLQERKDNPLRIALIGAGKFAAMYLAQVPKTPGVELVGIADLALPRLAGNRDDALLVIHDRTDREVSFEHGARLAATWPKAQLRETDGLGHRKILRDPDVLAATVEFVRLGAPAPISDLVREVDRFLDGAPS